MIRSYIKLKKILATAPNFASNISPDQQILNLIHDTASKSNELNLLTDNLAASIVMRDAKSDIKYCNPYTEVLFGYPLSQIYSDPELFFSKIVHPDDLQRLERARKVAEEGEPFQVQYRFTHKSGIEMWGESRTVPIFNKCGEYLGSLTVIIDITGMRRAQKQLEEQNRDLHDFSYIISHDLKGPIGTIKGMLGVINETSPIQDHVEPLKHISRATRKLEQLVSSLLDYARVSFASSSQQHFSFVELLNEVIQDLKPSMLGVTLTAPTTDIQLVGDRLQINQAITNLISNSLKYKDSDRKLDIHVSVVRTARGNSATIRIQDNGIGIQSELLPNLFKPFQRGSNHHLEGNGIGLASVKRIIERHGGTISVESTEGIGTSFIIKLPCVSE